jgi:cysteinyl-tRNA synthetase
MNNLHLTNSLTNKKEVFNPINKDRISLYACGPTVYDNPHVGNARALVVFDLLFRILIELYGENKVTYVRNITDIDDKIIEASKNKKINISDLTKNVTEKFHEDCKILFCLNPTKEPRATDHVEGMISMTKKLIEKNAAYEKEGHVFFSVASFKKYGKLSNKNPEDLKAGARVEVSKLKKDPLDFVLWKPSDNNDPGWDSPW